MTYRYKWHVHLCGRFSPDKRCRTYSRQCHRLHICTPVRNIGIALAPGARFAGYWDSGPNWIRIVRHPI